MNNYAATPQYIFKSIKKNKNLIISLIKRDIIGRYQGSIGGVFWSLFNPILMLAIYTFVFGVIFKARFGSTEESDVNFSLALFIGLIIFGLLSECLVKSPTLIISHVNYVKKVVFPLELLTLVTFGASFFHAAISFLVWLIFYLIVVGTPNYTMLLFPFFMLPIYAFSLGSLWLFSALGVYLRDIGQLIALAITALLFLSAIFYPISSLPENFQLAMGYNPLAVLIDQSRALLMCGKIPDALGFLKITSISLLYMWFGLYCFQKFRKGFADVI